MGSNTHTVDMPMAGSRDAPRFHDDASGFDMFFEDVETLAERAKIKDADKITWAIRYAGSESDSWRHVPCLTRTGHTFADFRKDVMKCYPHLSETRRYTIDDLDRLVERTRDYRNMSRSDLGEYYRHFITYSSYLLTKGRLSERERNSAYLRGFPQPVRTQIYQRLAIKKPDILPDEGFEFADIHDAALFVMNVGSSNLRDEIAPKVESTDQGQMGGLIQAMASLTRAFSENVQAKQSTSSARASYSTPGGVSQRNPPQSQWNQNRPNPNPYPKNCMFCSDESHFVRDCPVAAKYLVEGRIIRDGLGKLALPDGRYPPNTYPGKNMRERVDSFWISQNIYGKEGPPRENVETHFLEGIDECVFAVDVDGVDPATTSSPSARDDAAFEAQMIQLQIDSLREAQVMALEKGKKKMQFDGVELMKRTGPPRPGMPIPPPPSKPPPPPSGPNVFARGRSPSNPNPVPKPPPPHQPPSNQPSNVVGKPGTRAGDRSPQRPQGPMRPVDLPPKPVADDPKYRYKSAVETFAKPDDLTDRALDTKFMISTRELLASSPDVRRQVKDFVTSKKVSTNAVEVDGVDAYLTGCLEPNSSPVCLDLYKYDSSAAVSSLPLRVIYPTFAQGVQPECILDGGAQVVVMRKDVWEKLRVPIVANLAMPMESANASTSMTLGLIQNHPVQFGPITIHLQIQVVENAPFEVLLGRPFFDVTNCSETSTSGGSHEIRIKDPKTGNPYVFPTEPRTRKTPTFESEIPNRQTIVNFRQ